MEINQKEQLHALAVVALEAKIALQQARWAKAAAEDAFASAWLKFKLSKT